MQRQAVGAVEGGEGWVCKNAGVVEFGAAVGPARGAEAAGPGAAEMFARERVDAAGEVKQRAGEVGIAVFARRVDADAHAVQRQVVQDEAARLG